MRWRSLALVAIVLAVGVRTRSCCRRDPAPVRLATFNIEDWPKDRRQIEGAFDEIAGLDAGFVAVQEITDPALFAAEAANRLGGAWQFVAIDTAPIQPNLHPTHHLGVLYDRTRWTVVDVMRHDETMLGGRYKPTLEVRLRAAGGDGGPIVRVLVVHFKSGGEPDTIAIRVRQLRALATVIAYRPDDRTVVLGDFNATSATDREGIAAIAAEAHLWWATRDLACSAFWSRDDGCFRSRLDHVLIWYAPEAVEAAGGCATHGCAWEETCPTYTEHVSDHCPVVVTLDALH